MATFELSTRSWPRSMLLVSLLPLLAVGTIFTSLSTIPHYIFTGSILLPPHLLLFTSIPLSHLYVYYSASPTIHLISSYIPWSRISEAVSRTNCQSHYIWSIRPSPCSLLKAKQGTNFSNLNDHYPLSFVTLRVSTHFQTAVVVVNTTSHFNIDTELQPFSPFITLVDL
jgi:hypothetical protein